MTFYDDNDKNISIHKKSDLPFITSQQTKIISLACNTVTTVTHKSSYQENIKLFICCYIDVTVFKKNVFVSRP